MAIFKMAYAKRIEMYAGLFAVIAAMAVAGEVSKAGGFIGVSEIFAHIGHWIAHFVADTTSAEVGAAVMFRVFGAAGE